MVHYNENIVTGESASDEAKIGYTEKEDALPQGIVTERYNDDDPNHHLHRGLKSRQISMIAIGGAIGTGLIIGTYVIPPSPAIPQPLPRSSHPKSRRPLMIRVQQAVIWWRCHAAGNYAAPRLPRYQELTNVTLQGTSTRKCRSRFASDRLRCRRRSRVYGYGGSG